MGSSASLFDVAVVGAGPVGSIAALTLADQGYKVVLIGPEPAKDGRTTAILSEGIKLFEEIGVWAELAEKTAALKVMRMVDGSKRLIRAPEANFMASEIGLDAFGYNIINTDLNHALAKKVAEQPLIARQETTVEDAVLRSDALSVLHLASGTEVSAKLIVAADGRRSRMRELAGIEAREWSYPQTALVMNLTHTRPHNNVSTEFHTETGPFTIVPLPEKRSSLVWVETPEEAEKIRATDAIDVARMISRKSHYILGDCTLDSEIMAYPLSSLIAKSFGQSGVLFIGETAHAFPPIGAQGMNLGLRDIRAVLDLLQKQRLTDNVEDLCNAYAKRRQFDVTSRTTAVDMLNRSLLSDFLPVHLTRGLALYTSHRVPFLRQYLMRRGLGVDG